MEAATKGLSAEQQQAVAQVKALLEKAFENLNQGSPETVAWRLVDAAGLLVKAGVANGIGVDVATGRGFRLDQTATSDFLLAGEKARLDAFETVKLAAGIAVRKLERWKQHTPCMGWDCKKCKVDKVAADLSDAIEKSAALLDGAAGVKETVLHQRDEDCAPFLSADDGVTMQECTVCHVVHGPPCPACGDRGFHRAGCAALAKEEAAAIFIERGR